MVNNKWFGAICEYSACIYYGLKLFVNILLVFTMVWSSLLTFRLYLQWFKGQCWHFACMYNGLEVCVHILLVFTMVWSSLSTFCQYSQWFSCTTLRQTFCYLKALYPHSTPVSPDSRETAQLPTGALFLSRNGVLSTSASGLPCLTTQTPRLHTPTTILTSFVNHSLQGECFL